MTWAWRHLVFDSNGNMQEMSVDEIDDDTFERVIRKSKTWIALINEPTRWVGWQTYDPHRQFYILFYRKVD